MGRGSLTAVRLTGIGADLAQIVAHRAVDVDLLNVMLDLFDGLDVTAVLWTSGRSPGFYKQPDVPKRMAVKAHLLGTILAGAYPFRGVSPRCGCPKGRHSCDGEGARYICIDLDAKNGEQDIRQRVGSVLGVCGRLGLRPLTFTSRSAKGAHVYLFLNRPVTTTQAHAAGRAIAVRAGIHDRCDVIPSPAHTKGYGTLHALPLSPRAAVGGGVLLDDELRPVAASQVVQHLRRANAWRSEAGVVEDVVVQRANPPARPMRKAAPDSQAIVAAAFRHHPQFKRAAATPPDKWRGGRSSRDAYLTGFLRRQGVGPGVIADVLAGIPGGKADGRGAGYVAALVAAQDAATPLSVGPLAGMPLPKQSALIGPPWESHIPPRCPPPRSYASEANPWWADDVQQCLVGKAADAIVLAYLVDRYFRGAIKRRMFYASHRELAEALALTPSMVSSAIRRLAGLVPDVLRVVPGVPHPKLRLATAFYIVDKDHLDKLDWYVPPGRSNVEALSLEQHAGMVDGNAGPELGDDEPTSRSATSSAIDLDAGEVHDGGAGAVLRGDAGVVAYPQGVLVPRLDAAAGGRADAGQSERWASSPAGDEGQRRVWDGQVPAGPAEFHRDSARGGRRKRAWRTPRSTYALGEDTVFHRASLPAGGLDAGAGR